MFFGGVIRIFHGEYHVCEQGKIDSSLPTWTPCILFDVWLLRLRLPTVWWIKVLRVDIPIVFLTLGGKLSLSPLKMIWAVGLSYLDSLMLRHDTSIPPFMVFFFFSPRKDAAAFCQTFILHLWRGSCGCYPFFYQCDVSHQLICRYWIGCASQE